MRIAQMIRAGRSTRAIAESLNLSARTVESHRLNIREKLGIKNRKANLRSVLSSL
jgi:DNA-binding CsgD family transcriptional regulator